MTPAKKTFRPVTSRDVCAVYELLHKKGFVAFPLTEEARQKIDATVASVNNTYFGIEPYPTAEEKAVAYLYLLIKDHPFTDGNKRTASLVFSVVCALNDLTPNYDYESFGLDTLAVYIEKVQEQDHHRVIRLISKLVFERPKWAEN